LALPGPWPAQDTLATCPAGGVLHQPLAPGPCPRAGSSRPLRGRKPPKSPFWGFSPKKAHFGPPRASPGPRTFRPRKRTYRAPARGVDVKPPPAGSRKVPKKARFGQNGQKWPKTPKMGILAVFRLFWGFQAPWALPGTRLLRGFYINPSRRGPVPVLAGGGLLATRSAVAGAAP